MSDLNKRVLRRLFDEVIKCRNFALVEGMFAPHYVNHSPFPPHPPHLPSLKKIFSATPPPFPPTRGEPKKMIAAGDLVAYRAVVTGTHRGEFAGLKPTGRRVEVTEINISRFRDGLMVEHWALLDEASMMRQLAGR